MLFVFCHICIIYFALHSSLTLNFFSGWIIPTLDVQLSLIATWMHPEITMSFEKNEEKGSIFSWTNKN